MWWIVAAALAYLLYSEWGDEMNKLDPPDFLKNSPFYSIYISIPLILLSGVVLVSMTMGMSGVAVLILLTIAAVSAYFLMTIHELPEWTRLFGSVQTKEKWLKRISIVSLIIAGLLVVTRSMVPGMASLLVPSIAALSTWKFDFNLSEFVPRLHKNEEDEKDGQNESKTNNIIQRMRF